MSSEFPNLNSLWSAVLVETLHRKGVVKAVICPGSRSSPLAFAFAEHGGIEAISVLDERSAGFFALGMAKESGSPVALVCTSGSATANFFPAVVEASESGVPLVLLTADRPQELRDCSAGQTIDQVKFFGEYVSHTVELALPDGELGMLRYLRQTISHACDLAVGPIHVNVPFRDPLIPVEEADFSASLQREDFGTFFSQVLPASTVRYQQPDSLDDFFNSDQGLVLIGPNSPVDVDSWTANVSKLANHLNWPVLADGLNPVRSRSNFFETLISGYEFILRSKSRQEALMPDRVLVIGELPTCKALREWLAALDCRVLVLSNRSKNFDSTHSKSKTILCNLETDAFSVLQRAKGNFVGKWLELDAVVEAELSKRMTATSELFEGKLAWLMGDCLPQGSALSISNSMPPRDMEFYFRKSDRSLSVYSSRGASGIDGILSTALGVAHSNGKINFLLTGDLALLHDTNGALIAKRFNGSLTILLVNNSGGGIFENLPVSQFGKTFEEFWVTDQKIDFQDWAKTYAITHRQVATWEELAHLISEPFEKGVRILEFRTSGKIDAATRKTWFQEIAAKLLA